MEKLRTLVIGAVLGLAPLASNAAIIHFTATLTGDQERPTPNTSTATGTASGTLDTDTNVFQWLVNIPSATPMTGGFAAAGHFHGNTDAPPGHTDDVRGVVLGFMGGGVDPDILKIDTLSGNTFGTFSGTVDIDLVPGALANIAGLIGGRWYVNIHTQATNLGGLYPGGEIRGQFLPANLVPIPLPAAAWAFGAGLIALASAKRRREV